MKFKVVVVEENGEMETKMKVVKIRDGTESCHVGFLPRHILHGSRKEKFENQFGQVLELYKESNDMTKQRKNARLFGVASVRLLGDIQNME